jgi:hypothetical protein
LAWVEQESGKEDDVSTLITEVEVATDVDSACEELQTLVRALRPSDDILRKAGWWLLHTS